MIYFSAWRLKLGFEKRFSAFIIISLSGLLLFPIGGPAMGEEKIGVGLAEEVILMPWGVRMPARIDTGAATSSLDARGLTVKGDVAEFRLPDKYGGLELRLPILHWRVVRSAQGKKRRPVVGIDLCIGSKRLRTEVNLMDRSGVSYPMIIGRNVLRSGFVVDCMKSHCAPPSCPEAPGQ